MKEIGTTERHARKWLNHGTYEGGLMRQEGKELIRIIDQLRDELKSVEAVLEAARKPCHGDHVGRVCCKDDVHEAIRNHDKGRK